MEGASCQTQEARTCRPRPRLRKGGGWGFAAGHCREGCSLRSLPAVTHSGSPPGKEGLVVVVQFSFGSHLQGRVVVVVWKEVLKRESQRDEGCQSRSRFS